jgi:enoyl-CoA hydratase/carnithine racemase
MSSNQFTIDRIRPSFWEVTFRNPPINLVDPVTIAQLNGLLDEAEAEADPHLTVVVFGSADPDFFIAHYDIASDLSALAGAPRRLKAGSRRNSHF